MTKLGKAERKGMIWSAIFMVGAFAFGFFSSMVFGFFSFYFCVNLGFAVFFYYCTVKMMDYLLREEEESQSKPKMPDKVSNQKNSHKEK